MEGADVCQLVCSAVQSCKSPTSVFLEELLAPSRARQLHHVAWRNLGSASSAERETEHPNSWRTRPAIATLSPAEASYNTAAYRYPFKLYHQSHRPRAIKPSLSEIMHKHQPKQGSRYWRLDDQTGLKFMTT